MTGVQTCALPISSAAEPAYGSAALKPITDERGNHVGALEIQRNVTDEAVVQVKYQEMLAEAGNCWR